MLPRELFVLLLPTLNFLTRFWAMALLITAFPWIWVLPWITALLLKELLPECMEELP
jgi:hypothetical protein